MGVIISIVVLVATFWFIYFVVRGIWRMLGKTPTPKTGGQQRRQATQADTGMTSEEEGNVHSGPYGYSPNTAYPETQYGSLFNPDAEWNHEEQ